MNKKFTFVAILCNLFVGLLFVVGREPEPREVFRRLFESAHPLPAMEIQQKELPAIPLAVQPNEIFFNNLPTTVEEEGQYLMQNESSIAISPKNPNFMIASAVDYRDTSAAWIYYSTNGGRSWKNKKLGRPYPGWRSSNDPSVAISYDGVAYVVYGGFGNISESGILFGENGVFLARSTDEGKTWEAHIPIIVHTGPQTLDSCFEDKYYISVDNSPNSPFRGNLYVPWKRVIPRDSSTQIVISRSTDKGTTWSEPIPISPRKRGTSEDTTFGQSFPLATIGPNGEVYVVWNDGTEKSIGFAKSTDGGLTFTPPRNIIKYNEFGKVKKISGQGWRHTVKGAVRAEAYPSIVCDYTDGPRKGYLYLCWSADSVPNVYFSRSTDGGESWSEPVIVHSDTTNDQFWQWIALDPTNGDLAIMYLDSRDDPTNIKVKCYVSYSSDGGETWIDRCVSDVSSDLRLNPFTENSFAGDYSGCAFYDSKIFPSWVDMRQSVKNIFDSDVYTACVNINIPEPPANFRAQTIPDEPTSILLTWDRPTQKVFGHPLDTTKVNFVLKRENQTIAVLPYEFSAHKDTGLEKYLRYNYSIVSAVGSDSSIARNSSAFAGGSRIPLNPEIISAESPSQLEFNLRVKIPNTRSDSTTAFINPSAILFFDDETPIAEFPLTKSDTGQILDYRLTVSKVGYYKIRAKVRDSDGNTSLFSNTMVAFTGNIVDISKEDYLDRFDLDENRKYYKLNGWGYTSSFYYSPNSCITDSPIGNYPTRTSLELLVFPFTIGDNSDISISFQNAAIIHRTDTGYVEIVDRANKSIIVARFNMEDFEPWKDKVLDKSDWRMERISLRYNDLCSNLDCSQLAIRFRLNSGTLATDDGWYVDDLIIRTHIGSIGENTAKEINIYPNPVGRYLNIFLPNEFNPKSIYLIGFAGNKVEITNHIDNIGHNHYLLNVSSLPNGIYAIVFQTDYESIIRKFIVLR